MIHYYVVSEEERRKIEKRNKLDRVLRIIIKITFITSIVAGALAITSFPQQLVDRILAYIILMVMSWAITIIAMIIIMNLDLKQTKNIVAITCPNCRVEGNKENFKIVYNHFICPNCGKGLDPNNLKERKISIE